MNKRIAILGCGWLGLPLAKALLERGWEVRGSTTSTERLPLLQAAGIDAFRIEVKASGIQGDIDGFLGGVDVVFIDIPPGLRKSSEADFTGKIKTLRPHLERCRPSQLFFISSTSVYGKQPGKLNEEDEPQPDTESGKQLQEAESLMQQMDIPAIIIRYGGLLGPDRHPVKFLAGRTELPNGGAPVNLIQQEDAVHIPVFMLEKEMRSGVFNAVAPEHPSKASYYTAAAKERKLQPPSYSSMTAGSEMKQVDSVRLPALGYVFRSSIHDSESEPGN